MYGYHPKEHQFFKICLYNPGLIRKISTMLQSEGMLNRIYQPHETHIPFVLQFMMDYNLHGMSRIKISQIKLRDDPDSHFYDRTSPSYPKQSYCVLEGDVLAENILNRLEISSNLNPGIEALWADERQRRRNKNEESQIGPCLTLKNTRKEPTKSHIVFREALVEKLALLTQDSNDTQSGLDLSVYPAETPPDHTMLNASLIDFCSPLDESLNQTIGEGLNETLDNEAKILFELMQNYNNQNVEDKEGTEEDSILSQIVQEDEEDIDLSVPLPVSTPFKLQEDKDDCLDVTLTQIDGTYDSSSSEEETKTVKKKNVSKYQALPITVQKTNKTKLESDLEKAKRKLTFQNTTVVEETIQCVLRKERETTSSLTKAQLYDIETNYQPKEGCSSKLTQNSLERLSDKDIVHETIDSSSSDWLTPSQRQLDKTPISQQLNDIYQSEENFSKLTQNSLQNESNSDLFQNSSSPEDLVHETINSSSSQQSKKAQLYDIEIDYQPQEGSFQLTQNSRQRQNDHETDKYTNSTGILLKPLNKAPTKRDILASLAAQQLAKTGNQTPFYGNFDDITGPVEVGYSILKIPTLTTASLEDFKTKFSGIDPLRKRLLPNEMKKWNSEHVKQIKLSYCPNSYCIVTPLKHPPTVENVKTWLRDKNKTKEKIKEHKSTKIHLPASPEMFDESDLDLTLTPPTPPKSPVLGKDCSSQITGVTLNDTYGFSKSVENYQNVRTVNEAKHLTSVAMELHIRTRGDLKPDPQYDSIRAVFYSIYHDCAEIETITESIMINSIPVSPNKEKFNIMEGVGTDCSFVLVQSEEELLNKFIEKIRLYDPDILIGYEIEMLSWGFIIDRANTLGINYHSLLSRIRDDKNKNMVHEDGTLRITGRIVLDFWRLMRHEVALQSYTFENITYNLLHKRVPLISFKDLTFWWDHRRPKYRHRTINHYTSRTEGVLKLMEQLDLIGRTSELASLFGIQFFEVLSRGSQFRVESMMLRLAKPQNYIPVSPSVQQRAKMKAPEFIPLVLEPESKFYVDPVIVLDFQSLYPSIIIAYNYCFTTCIGKISKINTIPFEFGATQLKHSKTRLNKLVQTDCLNFSPCGVGFVKTKIRDGILPRMLREILDTRLMVKNSMKENKSDKVLQKVLHSRQLGLKLIANVTYGYTSANFSGRMPAVELGDSVVSKARETLQRAINLVENTPEWGSKVVYGDTDSLFVLTPGKTRVEAFEIGQKIAEAVTNDNPDPVKLKLEKVYQPCILQTKKRYVGYMYESPDQTEPVYNAKGIETVRRDGCPAASKMLEKCLRLLFETRDVSQVKSYVLRQFHKILTNRVSLQDLTFAKEYRGAGGYRSNACVPALELTR